MENDMNITNIQLYLLVLCQFCFVSLQGYDYNLAVCAIFRDEANYLKEWIEFHKLVGVQHFYMFQNQSLDDYWSVLAPYVHSGEVELIQWPYETNPDGSNWPTIQMSAYQLALELARGRAKWLA